MANATAKTVWKPEFTPKRAGRGAKGRKWSHITVHAAPEFHREYKLYAIENGLLMESFALFKKTRAGQEKRRAG